MDGPMLTSSLLLAVSRWIVRRWIVRIHFNAFSYSQIIVKNKDNFIKFCITKNHFPKSSKPSKGEFIKRNSYKDNSFLLLFSFYRVFLLNFYIREFFIVTFFDEFVNKSSKCINEERVGKRVAFLTMLPCFGRKNVFKVAHQVFVFMGDTVHLRNTKSIKTLQFASLL